MRLSTSLKLKIWLGLFLLDHIWIFGLWQYNKLLGTAVFFSFWHSESSIGLWMAQGYSTNLSICIAIFSGTIATLNWFWLANNASSLLKRIWDVKLEPPKCIAKYPYFFLPIISFVPDGGVFVAISYIKFFKLNQYLSFSLVTLGNIIKMITFGYAFHVIREYLGMIGFLIAIIAAMGLALLLAIGKIKEFKQNSSRL